MEEDCRDILLQNATDVLLDYSRLADGRRKCTLSCRGDMEFPRTGQTPVSQFCISGQWTYELEGYEIPSCVGKS